MPAPLFSAIASKIDLSTAISIGVGSASAIGVGVLIGRALNRKDPFSPNISNNPDLVFPDDLDKYSISMAFDFIEYERRSVAKQPYMKPAGTIRLPICKNILESYTMIWEPQAQNAMVGATIEAMLEEKGAIKQGINDLITSAEANNVSGAFSALGNIFDSGKNVVGAGLAGAAIEGTKGLLSKVQSLGIDASLGEVLQPFGLAQNPFLTVLFKQPEFKGFKMNWRLAARNPTESAKINTIINMFKYYMLPTIAAGTGGTLLHYPSMVRIGFFSSDDYLFRFKPCVIRNLTVNYAPAATPSFFKGTENVPTEIDLSLDLLEIEYWTRDDFKDSIDGSTGGMVPGASTIS